MKLSNQRQPVLNTFTLSAMLFVGICAAAAEPLLHTDSVFPQDEPPVYQENTEGLIPPKITKAVQPIYPEKAKHIRLKGYVLVELVVRKDGSIDNMKVIRELARGRLGFEEASTQALRQWKFEPGTKDGKPVDVRMVQRFDYELQ